MSNTTMPPEIGQFVFPAALVFCDRTRERNGDYVQLATFLYSTMELKLTKAAKPHQAEAIRERVAQLRRGDRFRLSSCGQYTVLGHDLPEAA